MRILIFLVLLAFATPASSRTWYILPDGTGDAPTIQAGVDSAAAGDIVLVAAGTYASMTNVVIDGTPTPVCVAITKNIRLVSEDGPASTTIGNTAVGAVIYLDGVDSRTEVTGFRIRSEFVPFGCVDVFNRIELPTLYRIGIKCKNSAPRIEQNYLTDHGIAIALEASSALIERNTITLSLFGIICGSQSDATITNNIIHHCAELVRSEGNSSPHIIANEMYEGCTAVSCTEGSSVEIADNTIHHIGPVAVQCGGLSQVIIRNNRFFDNKTAVYLSGTGGNTIVSGNTFYRQLFEAIRLQGNDRAVSIVIENNTIDMTFQASGIFCYAYSSPLIRNNIIVRSAGGIDCLGLSFPVIECNNIFNVPYPYPGDCSDQTGTNGNISVDPQFCGVEDSQNYHLQGDSPCAPGNHPDGADCGLIGALSAGCGTVPTSSTTWGKVKSLYDGKRR